jgi:hypothetical protein
MGFAPVRPRELKRTSSIVLSTIPQILWLKRWKRYLIYIGIRLLDWVNMNYNRYWSRFPKGSIIQRVPGLKRKMEEGNDNIRHYYKHDNAALLD